MLKDLYPNNNFENRLDDHPDMRSLQQQVKKLKHIIEIGSVSNAEAIRLDPANGHSHRKFHQENGLLRQQLAKLKAQNADLHRRLEIIAGSICFCNGPRDGQSET
jgi:hypothetical protein